MNFVRNSCVFSLRHSANNKIKRMKSDLTSSVVLAGQRNEFLPPSHLPIRPVFWSAKRNIHFVAIEDNPVVSPVEIRRAIKSHFGSYEEGHTCISVECPSCKGRTENSSQAEKNIGRLYVNLRTGYTFCNSCFLQGPWSSLQSYLKVLHFYNMKHDNDLPSITEHLSPYTPSVAEAIKMRQLWNSAQPVHQLSEDILIQFLVKLHLGDVKLQTLEEMGAKVNLKFNELILPCKSHCDIEYQSLKVLRPVLSDEALNESPITTDTTNKERMIHETVLPQDNQWLMGYHLSKGQEEVLLTSSAADALVARQELSIPTMCLPNGITRLPLSTLALLEPFKKITLWLDDGTRGDEAARLFARKLSENRCNFIRSSEVTPFMLSYQTKANEVKKYYKSAMPMVHKAVTTFSSLRKEVFNEIAQGRKIAGIPWRKFPALTDLLKGHRRGELTVFTGPTGAGKTTFLSEYSLDLCNQGVRTLWGSFEIRNVRLAKMMLHQHSGISLECEPELFDAVADDFEKLPMYFMTLHGQQSVNSVLDAMSHAVYVHDISHIVIDNLQFMMGTGGSDSKMDRFHRQDVIVGLFRRFATEHNAHVTLVIHPRKEVDELSTNSIFGGAKASQEADNIMILQERRILPNDPSKNRKYLEITKNRYAGDLGMMPLVFNKESLSFAPAMRMRPGTNNTVAGMARKLPAPVSAEPGIDEPNSG